MKRSTISLLLFLALGSLLSAQTSRGTVTGLITDQSGAAIVNTEVSLRNTATNLARATTSNESGLYRFDAVDPGPYEVTVTSAGFKMSKTQSFDITASQVASVDVKLEVGEQKSVVVVNAESVQLQTESAVRGGTLSTIAITELPVANRNSVSLALTLPGVTTNQRSFGGGTFSVNGGRGRSNNFLIDGTENNDISVAGQAFAITLPDLVQETVVQTSNFDSEYGRAGGGVVNVVTKSGTNEFHGIASYLLDSTIDDTISNTQGQDPNVLKRGHPPAGTEQIFAGTFGGPIIKNRTFFFGGFQEDRQNAAGSFTATVPSAAGLATLRSLFPKGANANLDTYLGYIGSTVATSQFTNVALANGRPDVQFGSATVGYPNKNRDRLFSIKIDHRISDNDLLSGRYSYDEPIASAGGQQDFPGFDTSNRNRFQNAVISETHVFSPSLTNEFRLPYNRITLDFPVDTTNPLGKTLPAYSIAGITGIGVATNLPQGRIANNYGLQDTFTYTRGAHSIRGGLDLLDQRSRQFAPIVLRGLLTYNASTGYSGLANFVDDFGGSGGGDRRDFGSPAYYPKLFRQSYFVQDRWRASSSLTVTMGVRYEYFGVPENVIRTAAYTGLFNIDPVTLTGPFSQPSKVKPDKNNFSPSIGLAYSPSNNSGMLGRIFGERKTVIRTGYQIGYDSFFNNIASNAATSAPNVVATSLVSSVSSSLPRGFGNVSGNLPTVARALSPLDSQTLVDRNLVNPYSQKASFGIQRELPGNWLLDMSYVWTKGTKLFLREDANPLVPAALRVGPAVLPVGFAGSGRLDNLQGSRVTVTNGGSSYYNAAQASLTRRFAQGLYTTLAYTHAKLIDYGSDIFSNAGNYTLSQASVPAVFGGQKLEKGPSLFDRPNRLVATFYYQLPFFKNQQRVTGHLLGGFEVSGIYTYESGVPYSILNGVDADGIGGNFDRPDFNPSGQTNVRAVPQANGTYINPDNNNAIIDPKTAEFIGILANSGRTGNLGRNTERANPTNNLNVNILKTIHITERVRLEFRTEFYNILNHPQYGILSVSPFSPGSAGNIASTVSSSLAGRFQNQTFQDGGQRVIRYQLKIVF